MTMKAELEKVEKKLGSSFSVISYWNPYFAAPLHIHPEYELILIEEGNGLSFVGNSVNKLSGGDFMLIGSNLPHLWLSSEEYYEKGTTMMSHSIYCQFNRNIFPDNLYDIPELESVYRLLKKSCYGIYFSGGNVEELKNVFRSLVDAKGFSKLYGMYNLLHRLATECSCTTISSECSSESNDIPNPIINKVNQFINENYQNEISLERIAAHVAMNQSALCRYYKKHTGKRIFEYLMELRISYAVKLMINKNIPMNQIAYDCGYNSLSHFYHQFKNIMGLSPSEYMKDHLKLSR